MKYLPFLLLLTALAEARPVLVISVDGLDHRYLADADKLGLKIPNLRRLIREGQWAQGIIGVVPTVTWPSHTSMISGTTPAEHGILSNRRPPEEGGDYYWNVNLLKSRTLLDALQAAGRTSATITWPVTVDAPVTYNLPEYFKKRRGGAMDLPSISSKSKPADLVQKIAAEFPSFAQEWMDDRTRALATLYLLKSARPDLILVHFVDLDSEAHDNTPFSPQANAILEYTDELIGRILAAMPKEYAFVLVSDHGFERVEKQVHLNVLAKQKGVTGVRGLGGVATADTPEAAAFLRGLGAGYGVGREIPKAEVARFSSILANSAAVFESAPHFMFGFAVSDDVFSPPRERGAHGHWPMRYRAVYCAWGQGIRAEKVSEFSMTEIAGRLARLLGVEFTPGPR